MQERVQTPALDAAISRYQGYLRADPGNPHLLVKLGELYQRCGKLEDAMACYEQCAKSPLVGATARLHIGRVWLSQRRYHDAEQGFRSLVEERSADASPFHYLGISLFHQQRWKEALEALNQARDAGICTAENAAYRAQALHRLGFLELAIKACEEWLAREPCDAAYAYLALLYMDDGNVTQAHELAQYVLRRDPANADAALVEWVWCLEQRCDDQAQHLLPLAVRPGSARQWLASALQRAHQRDARTALLAVQTALEHLAEDGDTALTVGWTQLGLKNLPEAKRAFNAALACDGNLVEAHIGLAIALLLESAAHKQYDFLSTLLNAVHEAGADQFAEAGLRDIVQHVRERLREQAVRAPYLESALQ